MIRIISSYKQRYRLRGLNSSGWDVKKTVDNMGREDITSVTQTRIISGQRGERDIGKRRQVVP